MRGYALHSGARLLVALHLGLQIRGLAALRRHLTRLVVDDLAELGLHLPLLAFVGPTKPLELFPELGVRLLTADFQVPEPLELECALEGRGSEGLLTV